MDITIEQVDSPVAVTVMRLDGDLDARSYLEVIDRARSLYASGTRNLVVDMSDVGYMGSSGIVALHSIALTMAGREPPDPEYGWSAHHAVGGELADEHASRVRLAGLRPQVARILERTGLARNFDLHDDRQAALDSFAG